MFKKTLKTFTVKQLNFQSVDVDPVSGKSFYK